MKDREIKTGQYAFTKDWEIIRIEEIEGIDEINFVNDPYHK